MFLSLPLPPTLNALYRTNPNGHGLYKTKECKDWEETVQWLAKPSVSSKVQKGSFVHMEVVIFYHYERDIDSCQKALQDCLQGYAYDDDRQIVSLLVRKIKDTRSPRLEVRVDRISEQTDTEVVGADRVTHRGGS